MINALLDFLRKIFTSKRATEKSTIGAMGENAATKFLKSKGVKIIKRNFRSGKNEIDIICKDGDVLAFVEVKTRKADARVNGYFAGVQTRKKVAVKTAAKDYMRSLRNRPKTWRFDVIEVQYSSQNKRNLDIRHYENVY